MDHASLRELFPLEAQLHQEMITALEKSIENDGLTEDGRPSRALMDKATKISMFFETVGFVLTNTGVMARIDKDILDETRTDLRVALKIGWAEAEMAMHGGPTA